MEDNELQPKKYLLLIGLPLVTAILYDYLFNNKNLGISYPIFTLLFLALVLYSRKISLKSKNIMLIFLGIVIITLAMTFALYSNYILLNLNCILIPILLAVFALISTDKTKEWWKFTFVAEIIRQILPFTSDSLRESITDITGKFKSDKDDNIQSNVKKIGIGLGLSILILLVVLPLLSSADLMFGHYIANFQLCLNIGNILDHAILIFIAYIYFYSYLWVVRKDTLKKDKPKRAEWDTTIVITVLSVLNLVYLLFSIVQLTYLYGGPGRILPDGYSYAEYARSGFFQLVAVALINWGLMLGCTRYIEKSKTVMYRIVQILLCALILFTLNMLFSAHFKMSLYEQMYGLTYLRVFVHYCMGLLFVLFMIALVSIYVPRVQLMKISLVVSLAFYCVLNVINVDRIIARYNLDLYSKTGKIDTLYFYELSHDAVSEVALYIDENSNNKSEQMAVLKKYLLNKNIELSVEKPWEEFNLSRYRTNKVLEDIKY